MSAIHGREVRLAARPQGAPQPGDFRVATSETPKPGAGQILLKNHWISVDPMTRILIDAKPLGGAMPPYPLDAVIPGAAVGEVLESQNPDFKAGDYVEGRIGWREYAVSDGAGLRKVDPADGPLSHQLGVLGLPGFSAYVGFKVSGGIQPGQTVLISGAAGAVGSVAGPLAKLAGATVVGIASGPDKIRALTETLGFDRAVDRTAPDFDKQLADAVPNGADVYFDNVGGPLFLQVLKLMARQGRVIVCGLMAQYVDGGERPGPDRLADALEAIMGRSLTVKAFSNTNHPELRAPFLREVGGLLREGRLAAPEHISEGIESVPAAFSRLFTDSVVGKSVIRL